MADNTNVPPLKLVPFNSTWIDHDKIDIHAIYRRPRFTLDEYGEKVRELDPETKLPTWDLTGPLPIRQHNRWTNKEKGFEYVTLANREALVVAARYGTLPEGTTYADFNQHAQGGPWNYRRYRVGLKDAADNDSIRLRQDIDELGWQVVERVRQQVDPTFKIPDEFKKPAPKAKAEKVTA
jgi:hypothetical protein